MQNKLIYHIVTLWAVTHSSKDREDCATSSIGSPVVTEIKTELLQTDFVFQDSEITVGVLAIYPNISFTSL